MAVELTERKFEGFYNEWIEVKIVFKIETWNEKIKNKTFVDIKEISSRTSTLNFLFKSFQK